MTEGTGVVKTKRMGARFFKNPPQPHMCIRDSLKGSPEPCYVNVLSWDKVALGMSSEGVPLYGGMKVCPPRTEKKEVAVFAVMANPEILKVHGKNARNPKERSWLIDMLLDFVEKMNDGVVFDRRYTVLRDRDITGELKEIWMVVQSERAKAQQPSGSDELRRPVPQYPHYHEQQHQTQQFHQHPQQQQQQQQQQHQQQQQQQQQQHPHDQHAQQPPQYHSNVYYAQENNENCESYELSCARQNFIFPKRQRNYLHYDSSNASRMDRYSFREPIVLQNPQVAQQNCLNYPAYQYQRLPRGTTAPFPPNIHPNQTLNCPPAHGGNPMNLVRPEPPPMHYNKLPIDKFYETFHRMQPQQSQIYYQAQNPPSGNYLTMLRPQEPSQESGRRKPIIVVDPRDALIVPPQPPPPPPLPPQPPPPTEQVAAIVESSVARVPPLQQTDLAAATTNLFNLPINTCTNNCLPRDDSPNKASTISFVKLFRPQEMDPSRKYVKDIHQVAEAASTEGNESLNCRPKDISFNCRESLTWRNSQQYPGNQAKDDNSKKTGKPKIKVLKRNTFVGEERNSARREKLLPEPKGCFETKGGDSGGLFRDAKRLLNSDIERLRESKSKDRTSGKDADVEDRLNKIIPECERNGNADKRSTDSARIIEASKSVRSALKILAGSPATPDEVANKKKSNGQVYTILRKAENTTSREDVTSNIAQLSFNDCGEGTSQVGAVLS